MPAPPKCSFRRVERTPALEERIRELAQRLQRCNERIDQCHVTLERRTNGRNGLRPCQVQIDLSVPGAEIRAIGASSGSSGSGSADQSDIFLALNAAFDDAKRQLQELHRERVGEARR
jgi:ribosome-associated translation inhibitor RaiA